MDIAVREYIQARIVEEDHGHSTRCWIWQLSKNAHGYGQGKPPGGCIEQAHRFSYREYVGQIPAGFHLDHLCRVRDCCNPDHLEPVTPAENTRRALPFNKGSQRKTHCKRGHEFTPENTIREKHGRRCRTCQYAWQRERYRQGPRKPFDPNNPRNWTHCKRGHEMTPENTVIWSKGQRRCRVCTVAWHAEHDNWEIKKARRAAKAAAHVTRGGAARKFAGGDDQQAMALTHCEGVPSER